MSFIEGGNFQCYIHKFETAVIEEWNNHCVTNDCGREEGSTRCRDCDKEIKFKNLPFKPFDAAGHKNISISCNDCLNKQLSANVWDSTE